MEITFTAGQIIAAFLAAMSIPSAITGFIIWNFERKITQRDKAKERAEEERRKAVEEAAKARRKEAEESERAREELELIIIEGNGAAIALAEATARAVQRIPDAHCNGDMHAALEYAAQVKHRQKNFLSKQGIKAVVS